MQHAHLKGIIHRDLKPSNILVELHDVIAMPKVIDFGVAKSTHHRLTQNTIYTRFSQMIGTPRYMSPEQAQLSGMDIDTRSDTAEEYVQRAATFQRLNQFSQAIADYEQIVALEPNNARRHHELAVYLNYVLPPPFRDYKLALKHAEKVVELQPNSVSNLVFLAEIYRERFQNNTQALLYLNRALEIAPSDAGAITTRGKIHRSNGEYVQALADADKAIQLAPNSGRYLERAKVYFALRDFETALADCSLAEETNRRNSYVYTDRSDIYAYQKRYQEALVDLNKSLQIAPLASWVYKRRGLVHFQLEQYSKALADIAKALELNPKDVSCITWIDSELAGACGKLTNRIFP